MPKRKPRRNRALRQPAASKKTTESSSSVAQNDLIIVNRIRRIDFFIIIAALVPAVLIFLQGPGIVTKGKWVILISGTIVYFSIYLAKRINRSGSGLLREYPPYSTDVATARKIGVRLLALSFLVNIAGWMPLLYVNGYIARLAVLIPGKQELGNKASLGIAFGLGAIISGVLGNLAYDILKFMIRNTMSRKN